MYEPQLWAEGTFVQHFYEARKPGATLGPVDVKTRIARNVPEAGAFSAM